MFWFFLLLLWSSWKKLGWLEFFSLGIFLLITIEKTQTLLQTPWQEEGLGIDPLSH